MLKGKKSRDFTVIVIPHQGEQVWNVKVPLLLFQAIGVLLVVLLVVMAGWAKSYISFREEAVSVAELREENRRLNREVDLLAQETVGLKEEVAELDALSAEVRNLIEESDVSGEGALFAADKEERALIGSRGGNDLIDRTADNISFLQALLPVKEKEMSQLKEGVEEYQRELEATPSIWPAEGRVSSRFGPRTSPVSGRREFHKGLDIAAPRGQPVYAAAKGVVETATYRGGFGNVVIIEHGYGYRTLYAHLSRFKVEAGDEVEKGDVIGGIGSTGFSTGPHLHYEVHKNGVAEDPEKYLP